MTGVTRTEPENQGAEFLAVVRSVLARQDELRGEPATLRGLSAPCSEDAEPVILERAEPDVFDDPEDLAEFDREVR